MTWKQLDELLSVFALMFLFLAPSHVSAVEVKEKTDALVIGKVIKIRSKILNEERPVWIYLPENYTSSDNNRYPVLYMLDGAYHFHHITGAVQYLAKRERIPQMIVIAIPYLDYDRRDRDLSPTSVDGYPPVAGADNFLKFLTDELMTFIEKNYRTVPYRVLFGHSRAGLFSIDVLFKKPELFNSFFSISPSLYWDDGLMFKKMETFSVENTSLKKTLFLSAADGDPDQVRIPTAEFAELLEKKSPKGLEVHYSFMENETHGSTVHRAFYNALESLYSDWRLTPDQIDGMTFEQIREYYANLSKQYGYEVPVPSWAAFPKAHQLGEAGRAEEAIELSKVLLAQYPTLPEAHFIRGLTYLDLEMLEAAREKFETALKMSDESSHLYRKYKYYLAMVVKKLKDKNQVN